MSGEIHIQTISRLEDPSEPSTAMKIDIENLSMRQLAQFYLYLKHCVRHIEKIIDEDLTEDE